MAKLTEVVGLSSTSSVFALIRRLTEAGYLERVEGCIAPSRKLFDRPVLGRVRARLPEPASQEQPDVITIEDFLIDDPNCAALVNVRGDSMTGVGLMDGDIAVVETNSATKPGDIVLAVVDGDLMVKTLRLDRKGSFYREAANPAFEPIRPRGSLEIVGVVLGSSCRFRRRA